MSSKHATRALPAAFITTTQNTAERYWAILGVPFRDPAIRLRLLSVLVRPSESGASAPLPVSPMPADGSIDTVDGDDRPLASASRQAAPPPTPNAVRPRLAPPKSTATDELDSAQGQVSDVVVDDASGKRSYHRHGVAINTRVDDEETQLLTALGFEVVRDRCENFTSDLEHYAEWLQQLAKNIQTQASEETGRR